MVGTKRTEAFEGAVNLVPEIISRDADMAPWDGAIAQFEPRLIAERTRDGVAAARAEGRHPGRPKLDQEKLRAALTLIRNGMSPPRRPVTSASADQPSIASSRSYPPHCPERLSGYYGTKDLGTPTR